jgi:CRP-like cAMP-binding protein
MGLSYEKLLELAARQGLSLCSRSYPAGALVFGQADPPEELYLICDGVVKLAHVMEDGGTFILRLMGPEDLFGKSVLIESNRRAYAQTLRPSRLLALEPHKLNRLLAGAEGLGLSLLRQLTREAYESQVRLVVASRGNLQEQLAVLLWFLQNRFGRITSAGVKLELKLPCQMLAEMLGHSRQRVNEALGELRQKGLVEACYGKIAIRDSEGLKALCKPFLDVCVGGRSVTSVTDFLSQMR